MKIRTMLFALLAMTLPCAVVESGEKLDVLLKGGRIVDGTGAPWYVADVGIRAGRIARIGRITPSEADRVIDVAGLVVAPGFIDMMGQTASPLLENPATAVNLLSQGITTINCGEGVSAAPQGDESARASGWRTMAEYFQFLDMKGLPVNAVQTVGHTQLRLVVLGDIDRRPLADEMERMKLLAREAMEAGAIGLSTSLIYPPAVYARTEEIAELAKVAGQFGGRYYTHMRNEGDNLLEAVDEALEIGRAGDVPVHIFHLKAAGRQNWGKMELAIARIHAARATGQQVTADIYPYINNGLGIAALVHPRHFTQGEAKLRGRLGDAELRATIRKEMETTTGWENWFRHIGFDWNKLIVGAVSDKRYANLAGQSLAAMAKARDEDPWDTFFNLVADGAFVLPESMTEANVILALKQEFVSFCTDVGPAGGARMASHPRAFGAFPRLLTRYVRDQGAISLERAIAQASAVAANEVMAFDRGRITIGLVADIIAFDYDKLTDRATFAQPHLPAEGMKYVLVNGELVWDDGKQTQRRPGRVLRGPGYHALAVADAPDAKPSNSVRPLDRLFSTFMEKHRVPGCAVAVGKQGKLVYARGFGMSDVAERTRATPTSLFRIASISKPITAVATLQLVEQGKLKLDDRVFDILSYEPRLAPGGRLDKRQQQITIRQVLHHRGGWDRSKSMDPMFQSVRFAEAFDVEPPAKAEQIIRSMLGTQLDFSPGERYAYSNYGYCLLGRVIEKLSGQDYEEYVKEHVLTPRGIRAMRIGKTHLEDRAASEVRYYDPGTAPSVFAGDRGRKVSQPYGAFYLEAMDSHGAWLASAVDLVRFAQAFDDPQKCPILKPASIEQMFSPPPNAAGQELAGKPKDSYYALGWNVRPVGDKGSLTTWHNGSLPGTATTLIRRHDGLDVAVLFNARFSPYSESLTQAIDASLHQALDEVASWSETDLFDEY